jgi:hypothetical protein
MPPVVQLLPLICIGIPKMLRPHRSQSVYKETCSQIMRVVFWPAGVPRRTGPAKLQLLNNDEDVLYLELDIKDG